MFSKILSFVMASCICLILVPAPSFAVGPQDAFIASAIFSFVSSAGIHLFRDGLEASDAEESLVDDMQTLWGDFVSGFDGSPPSWDSVVGGEQIEVSAGKFIYDYSIALTLQDFVNWLSLHYNFVPGNRYPLTSSDGDVVYSLAPGYDWPDYVSQYLPLYYGPGSFSYTAAASPSQSPYNFDFSTTGSAPVYSFLTQAGDTRHDFYVFSTSPFSYSSTMTSINGSTSETSSGFSSDYGVTSSGQIIFYSVFHFVPYNHRFTATIPTNFIPVTSTDQSTWWFAHAFYTSADVAGSLLADVGSSVADLTYDLIKPVVDSTSGDVITPGQSLAIDVGLSADATEDDLVDRVVGGFVGGERAIGGFESVATPVPIEGTQELYPQAATDDIEGLGLPALGQALTNVFPFCIPFDIVALVKSLNAEALPPRFKVDLVTVSMRSRLKMSASTDTSFMMDFSDPKFEVLHKLIYWGTTLTFCISLALATKRLSWSSGG